MSPSTGGGREVEAGLDERTYRLGILNGALFLGALALSHPSRVLSGLVLELGGTARSIGLLTTLSLLGWLLPQLVISRRVQNRPYKKPVYGMSVVWRLIAWSALLAALAAWAHRPERLLPALFVCYGLYSLGGGISSIPFFDIVSKAIPPTRRGAFFGWRRFLGGILSVAAGFLVRWLLDEGSGIPFPRNYLLLLSAAFLLSLVGLTAFWFVHERPGATRPTPPLGLFLREGLALLRADPAFRMLLAWRWANAFAAVAGIFYPSFALEQIGVDDADLGYFVTLGAISSTFANLYWARISDRRGNRSVLRRASLAGVGVAGLALVSSLLAAHGGRAGTAYGLLLLVILLGDAGTAGEMLGSSNYLLEIGSQAQRPATLGFMNTFSLPLVLLPLAAGQALEMMPYQTLFALCLLTRVIGLLISWRMTEPRRP